MPSSSATDPGSGEEPVDGWMVATVLAMALAGGVADAGCYVFAGTFAGHITGNLILSLVGLAQRRWADAFSNAMAVGAFISGTIIGTFWLRRLRRHLVGALFAEAVLLSIGLALIIPGVITQKPSVIVLFCFSLGIQNGALSKIGPVSVHSTYITGLSTSLISTLVDRRFGIVSKLLPAVLGLFLLGALTEALLVRAIGVTGLAAVLAPIAATLVFAVLARRAAREAVPEQEDGIP